MDNAKGNKCLTVYAGLSALVALGVCVKCKLSFGLANHNHTDVDGTIGSTVAGVCLLDLPTFEDFEKACKNAIKEVLGSQNGVCLVGDCFVFQYFFESVLIITATCTYYNYCIVGETFIWNS